MITERDGYKIGDEVRRRGGTETARIASFYENIDGGVRLDCEIDGFKSWNVDELEHATK